MAGGGRGLVRLPVQTCMGRRAVVVGHDQQVRRRASPAAVRGAPRGPRGLGAVGAPVTQDWGSLVVRNMSRHPYDQKIGTRLFSGGYRILIRFVLMPARVMK